jgi:N-acetylglutamate synthase-like GNAT family acetyltransferase
MDIDYLANHKDVIPTLAQWSHHQWGYLYPERTLADVQHSISERTNKNKIPLALIALEGSEPLGTVCLKIHDMDTRRDLTPWLAGLYVEASRRGEGIGRRLVAAIEEKAKEMGIKKLFLFTPESEGFYLKLGWDVLERVEYQGHPATIMSKELASL